MLRFWYPQGIPFPMDAKRQLHMDLILTLSLEELIKLHNKDPFKELFTSYR